MCYEQDVCLSFLISEILQEGTGAKSVAMVMSCSTPSCTFLKGGASYYSVAKFEYYHCYPPAIIFDLVIHLSWNH